MQTIAWSDDQFRDSVAAAAKAGNRTIALLALLEEDCAGYNNVGAGAVERRRGWTIVELGKALLAPEALPYILEELETGESRYLIAAAARALRRAQAPMGAFARPLVRAIETLALNDAPVDLDNWGGIPTGGDADTALGEALKTLHWLGPCAGNVSCSLRKLVDQNGILADVHRAALKRILEKIGLYKLGTGQLGLNAVEDASCCSIPLPWRQRKNAVREAYDMRHVAFEDQDGQMLRWEDHFIGFPSVVAFFYTRCDNELKCSLTISKLAELQRELNRGQCGEVRLAAITYDPGFDVPSRLRLYSTSRGLALTSTCKALRVTVGKDAFNAFFRPHVGYAGSLVNRHRIELFLLDHTGQVSLSYERLSWSIQEVMQDLMTLQNACVKDKPLSDRSRLRRMASSLAPSFGAILLAILPKCPVCGVAYLSATGLAALPTFQGWERFWPITLIFLIVNVGMLAWMAAHNSARWASVAFSAIGTAITIGPGLIGDSQAALALGAGLVGIGSVLSTVFFGRSRYRQAGTSQRNVA
jgi:protein SCO1/2